LRDTRARCISSGLAGKDQRDVVWLFFGADPGVGRKHDLVGDDVEGLVAVTGNDLHEALFAELAEVVLGLGDAVGVGDEDLAGLHLEAVLFVVHSVHEADDGAAFVKAPNASVGCENQRRKLAGVRVSEFRRGRVVVREEERRVFFWLGAAIKVAISQSGDAAG
jgi:hypothetical protein